MVNWFRVLFYRLNKIIKIMPVAWRAESYDWSGLLDVIRHQLKELRKCLENGRHAGNVRHAKKIRICELLIGRLIDQDTFGYCKEMLKQHDLKWGKIKYARDTQGKGNTVKLSRSGVKCEKDQKLEHEEFIRIIKHDEYMKKQDINYLFDTMKKNLTSWWD